MKTMTESNFSGGPRSCIGKQLSYLEGKIAAIKFLRRYEHMKEPKERVFELGLTMRLKHSVV